MKRLVFMLSYRISVKQIKEHCIPDIQTEELLYLAMNKIDIFGKGNKNQVGVDETNQKMQTDFSEANHKKYKAAMEEHIQWLRHFYNINSIVYSLAELKHSGSINMIEPARCIMEGYQPVGK